MERDELRAVQAPLKERYGTLLKLTERYCVVFQSLSIPPELSASIATKS